MRPPVPRPVRRVLLVIACGTLVAPSACADDPGTDARVDARVDAGAAAAPATDAAAVYEVTAPVVGGVSPATISLADYRDAPLALWFWAPT